MVKKSKPGIQLCLEHLEERCVPAYLVQSYGKEWQFTVGGAVYKTSGAHKTYVNYESNIVLFLNPIHEVSAPSKAEMALLAKAYPGWTITISPKVLPDDSLQLHFPGEPLRM
jgi:hypothetical protein